MSLRSRSERKFARNRAVATTWVLGGDPKLRARGLAWFAQHNEQPPAFDKKVKSTRARPATPRYTALRQINQINSDGQCTCGSESFTRDQTYAHLETDREQVRTCQKCGKVWRVVRESYLSQRPPKQVIGYRFAGSMGGGSDWGEEDFGSDW